jgi:hypothetical protein
LTLLAADRESRPVLRLAGLSWSIEDFVRGWLITGRTGSGKRSELGRRLSRSKRTLLGDPGSTSSAPATSVRSNSFDHTTALHHSGARSALGATSIISAGAHWMLRREDRFQNALPGRRARSAARGFRPQSTYRRNRRACNGRGCEAPVSKTAPFGCHFHSTHAIA